MKRTLKINNRGRTEDKKKSRSELIFMQGIYGVHASHCGVTAIDDILW